MLQKDDNIAKSIIIANSKAAILDVNGMPISNPNRVKIRNKYVDGSQILSIFVNSGIIIFEENGAFLNFVIQESSKRTVMSQLGKVAEAVVVRRCSESEDINYRMFCIATGKKAHRETAKKFEAIGTGLLDTRIKHNQHYNPQDMQRDIIFVNKSDIPPALMSNATTSAGKYAGLQVKTSDDIIRYILSDVVKGRYSVPIICFPVKDLNIEPYYIDKNLHGGEFITIETNIYDDLIPKIMNSGYYMKLLIENNYDYFYDYLSVSNKLKNRLYEFLKNKVYDIRDIDLHAFDEVMFMKDLLRQLVYGKISLNDIMHKSETFKSYLMSLGLCITFLNVENNNLHVSQDLMLDKVAS